MDDEDYYLIELAVVGGLLSVFALAGLWLMWVFRG